VALGQQFHEQILAEMEVYDNQRWQDYFNAIGQSIVEVSDRKDIEYHFTVIKSEDINAFATPGGYVYIFTGLLDIIDNEAQLAAVTSHEIAHIVGRHSIKQMQSILGVSLITELFLGDTDSETLDYVIQIGLAIGMSGYSRNHERQADKFGVFYMVEAGYNPEGALGLFENLREASGQAGDRSFFENMFASHPETLERIQNVKNQINDYPPDIRRRDKNISKYREMKALLPE
jgi:predicted Zn-dependent protease